MYKLNPQKHNTEPGFPGFFMMKKEVVKKYFPPFIFLYTILILYLMFFAFSREEGGENYIVKAKPFESIIHVFHNIGNKWYIFKNIGGNIFMFVPYGFLGILYPRLKKFFPLFIVFFIAINYLEFLQFYSQRGFAEFDDVMLNSIGMSLGFLIYKKYYLE